MRKRSAILGSVLFFLAAPFMVGFVIPWWIAGWHATGSMWGVAPGAVLVAAGVVPLIDSFARFALSGLGTPAPVAPPRHLVVTGFYRFVRNPMYLAVLAIVLGNALLLGDGLIVVYAVAVALGFASFVHFYEEPALRGQFGDEYLEFCAHVPRWIPRLTPWIQANPE